MHFKPAAGDTYRGSNRNSFRLKTANKHLTVISVFHVSSSYRKQRIQNFPRPLILRKMREKKNVVFKISRKKWLQPKYKYLKEGES
jgi:hypothetical protein